jgi:hypothetical protein
LTSGNVPLGIDERHHIAVAVVDVVVTRGGVRVTAHLDAHRHAAGVIGEGGERRPALVGLVGEVAEHLDIFDAVAHPAAGERLAGVVVVGVVAKLDRRCAA